MMSFIYKSLPIITDDAVTITDAFCSPIIYNDVYLFIII